MCSTLLYVAKVARSYRLDAELVASMEIRAEALGQSRTTFVERAIKAALERFEVGALERMSGVDSERAPVTAVGAQPPPASSRASDQQIAPSAHRQQVGEPFVKPFRPMPKDPS